MLVFYLGCALHFQQTGLLEINNDKINVRNLNGDTYRLHAGSDHDFVKQLDGCRVWTKGLKVFDHIWVDDWKVTDAGDGSAPYIGWLERKGYQIYLRDINSGSLILLENVGELDKHIGHPILVMGIVVGAHHVKPMYWRLLEISK